MDRQARMAAGMRDRIWPERILQALAIVILAAGIAAAVRLALIAAAQTPGTLTLRLDPPPPAAPLPAVDGPADRPLVILDPGHGGHDPGAVAPGGQTREKDLTLALARTVRARILAGGRARVALTRDTDRYLSLRERIEIGRALGARLFISLHADAAPASDDAHGATIYTLSETASDAEAAALARSENRADIVRGIDLGAARADIASILIDLAQRETRADALGFARLLHREAGDSVPFRPDHLRTASLMVLKAPDMPSVLLEAGYITNTTDLAFIGAPDGQRRIADALARAIDAHFARKLARR